MRPADLDRLERVTEALFWYVMLANAVVWILSGWDRPWL